MRYLDSEQEKLLKAAAYPDASSPNFFNVNSSGEANAEFEGIINALGLTMKEAFAVFEAINQIRWINEASGNAREEIWGERSGFASLLRLFANRLRESQTGMAQLEANSSEEGQDSYLKVIATLVGCEIVGRAGPYARTIINDGERSNFLQLPNLVNSKMTCGVAKVTFTASKFSTELLVSHGLGVIPKVVVCTSGFAEISAGARFFNSTNFSLVAGNWLEAATNVREISWVAIS